MLGICNGFQVLCEAGLLPGVLRPNQAGASSRATSTCVVEQPARPGSAAAAGDILRCRSSITTARGRAARRAGERSRRSGQVLLRYVDNPNGSRGDVAGVTNAAGNVLGLMPHPEHAVDALLGSIDGRTILQGLLALAEQHARAIA